jgi:hypothetical protein
MVRRLVTYASIAGLILISGAFLVVTRAADLPETVTLDSCGEKQPPVVFPHAQHVDLTKCATCHHTQADLTAESTDAVETCASCHKDPEDPKTPSCAQMSPTKNPYHINCMGCHKKEKKKDASLKAPTKCKECHKK